MALLKGRMSAGGMGWLGMGDLQTLRNQLALAKSHLSGVRGTTATYPGKRWGGNTPERKASTFPITKTYGEIMGLTPVAGDIAKAPFGYDPTNKFVPTAIQARARTAIDTATHNVKAIEEQIAAAEQDAADAPEVDIEAAWAKEVEAARAVQQAAAQSAGVRAPDNRPVGPVSAQAVLQQQAQAAAGETSNLMPLLLLGGGAAALFFVLR